VQKRKQIVVQINIIQSKTESITNEKRFANLIIVLIYDFFSFLINSRFGLTSLY
jgi:hypothetical protein